MRDLRRIPRILGKLALLWARAPDARLGQLVVSQAAPGDAFYMEDEDLELILDKHIGGLR